MIWYGVTAKGVEWVKRCALRWFGHGDENGENEFVKKVYEGKIEGGMSGEDNL